jgi:large repetitive protein
MLSAMRVFLAAALAATALAIAAVPAAAQPACGDTITEDTTLTADMDCRGESGLVIGAPGITLDLGGYNINSFVTAIRNDGHADVTIHNGSVYGDTESIRLEGVTGNVIRAVSVGGLVRGITLNDSDNNRVVSSRLRSAALTFGPGSDHNVARDNLLTGREGVLSGSGSYNRIIENIVWAGDDLPFGLHDAHHYEVRRNVFVTSYAGVVWLGRADDNVFADNLLVAHGNSRGIGLELTESSRNRFVRNEFGGVPGGVLLHSGADNSFIRNQVAGAVIPSFVGQPDGFLVEAAATGTVLQGNLVDGFADDGLDVEAPGTRIKDNAANDNGDLGIEAVPGVIDLGGNSASGNGNPAQCTNVFCS